MKCPNCRKDMRKVTVNHDNWWHCDYCGRDVGKKAEVETNDKSESNK